MDLEKIRNRRAYYNERMTEEDAFFQEFASLDDSVYAKGYR